MIKSVNNINFNGRFRFVSVLPNSIEELSIYEVGEKQVSKELLDFAKKSKFLNKLKEDRDVILFHQRESIVTKPKQEPKGFFAKLFSSKKTKNVTPSETAYDYLSVAFKTNNTGKNKDIELCAIEMQIPVNKDIPNNLDRFDTILEQNSNIDIIKIFANKLFPNDTHKVTKLPNSNNGFCEFWTGKKSDFDSLDKLFKVLMAEVDGIYNKINTNIFNKTLPF